MPMGILSDEEFESEMASASQTLKPDIARSDNGSHIIPTANVEDIKRGRPPDTKEVPEIIRELSAKSAINGEGTGKQIAEAFGISPSSVSAYKVGAHSTTTYHDPNPNLQSKIVDHKLRISTKARGRLLSALNNLTPDKLENVRPRDLASIAKDMASIVKDMEPSQAQVNSNQNVQFVFMAPRIKEMDSFSIIDVKE